MRVSNRAHQSNSNQHRQTGYVDPLPIWPTERNVAGAGRRVQTQFGSLPAGCLDTAQRSAIVGANCAGQRIDENIFRQDNSSAARPGLSNPGQSGATSAGRSPDPPGAAEEVPEPSAARPGLSNPGQSGATSAGRSPKCSSGVFGIALRAVGQANRRGTVPLRQRAIFAARSGSAVVEFMGAFPSIRLVYIHRPAATAAASGKSIDLARRDRAS